MRRIAIRILFSVFAVELFLVWMICVPDTQYSLPMNRMIKYPLVCCAAYLIFTLLLYKGHLFHERNRRLQKILLAAYLILYSGIVYWCCDQLACTPRFLTDDFHVRTQAMYLAGLSDTSDWEYFATFRNNVSPMLLLSWLLRLGRFLGLKDPVRLVFCLNILQIDVAAVCIYTLILKFCQSSYKYVLAWLGVGILSVNLAAIGHSQSTYTDAMSFCFSILAFTVWSCIRKGQSLYKKAGLSVLAGSLWGIGAAVKMTALISFFAVICYVCFCTSVRKHLGSLLAAALAMGGYWQGSTSAPILFQAKIWRNSMGFLSRFTGLRLA